MTGYGLRPYQREAAERIVAACAQLIASGVAVTVNAIKRVTGSDKGTIARVLAAETCVPARSTPLIDRSSMRGSDRAPSNPGGSAPMEPWPSVGYPASAPLLVGALLPAAGPHAPPLASFARAAGDDVAPGGAP